MHPIIESMNWRYATKKFDPEKKISENDLAIIKESLRLTASSYGLQPIKFLFVSDPEIREQLVVASYGQRQVAEASHLLVICVTDELGEKEIEEYMHLISKTRGIDPDKLTGFSKMINNSTKYMEPEQLRQWIASQAYIALGQLLLTCATLRIDSTPMEGFIKEEYDRILNLKEKNLRSVLVCPIGYRHSEDPNLTREKVRKSTDDLFEEI